jgi:hypothetical protein
MVTKAQLRNRNENFCQRALLGWEIMVRKPDLFDLWQVGLRSNGNFALTEDGFEFNYTSFPSLRVWKVTRDVLEVTLVLSPIHKFHKRYSLAPADATLPFQDLFFNQLPAVMEDISDALQQETEKSRTSGDWYGQERKSNRKRSRCPDGQVDEQQSAA